MASSSGWLNTGDVIDCPASTHKTFASIWSASIWAPNTTSLAHSISPLTGPLLLGLFSTTHSPCYPKDSFPSCTLNCATQHVPTQPRSGHWPSHADTSCNAWVHVIAVLQVATSSYVYPRRQQVMVRTQVCHPCGRPRPSFCLPVSALPSYSH